MRGGDNRTGELFSNVDLENRVRSGHPLRAIRGLVNWSRWSTNSLRFMRLGGRRYRRRSCSERCCYRHLQPPSAFSLLAIEFGIGWRRAMPRFLYFIAALVSVVGGALSEFADAVPSLLRRTLEIEWP